LNAFGPTLMAHGSFSAMRLAAARTDPRVGIQTSGGCAGCCNSVLFLAVTYCTITGVGLASCQGEARRTQGNLPPTYKLGHHLSTRNPCGAQHAVRL